MSRKAPKFVTIYDINSMLPYATLSFYLQEGWLRENHVETLLKDEATWRHLCDKAAARYDEIHKASEEKSIVTKGEIESYTTSHLEDRKIPRWMKVTAKAKLRDNQGINIDVPGLLEPTKYVSAITKEAAPVADTPLVSLFDFAETIFEPA